MYSMKIDFQQQVRNVDTKVVFADKNFFININGFQLECILIGGIYEVNIMKNYITFRSYKVDEEDIIIFLMYFKSKTDT